MSWKKRIRQEQILSSLDKLGFATRSQLQQIHKLGTDRNALTVLSNMGEYLHVKRHAERNNENVYYLNQKGRELIGSEKERKYKNDVEHYLLRNDMYIHYNFPNDFTIEREIAFKSGLTQKIIRPDATFQKDNVYHFLEVDRTQSMIENKKKIALYAELSPLISTQFEHTPILIFYTIISSRKKVIEDLCIKSRLKIEVKTLEEIK